MQPTTTTFLQHKCISSTLNFKRQLNFANIFKATVDFANVWPTSKLVVECLTVLILFHVRLYFDFVSPVWCELELKKTLSQRYCGNGSKIRKASWDGCGYDSRTARPVATGLHSGAVPPQIFCVPQICCAQKNLFWTYNKNKNLAPLKCILTLQTIKPGYGRVHSSPEPRKWHFMKNITRWWIIPKITRLVPYFIKNIGYIQRGRERTSYKCIFFLLEL